MRNAVKISAGLHALAILASLFSIPWFDRDEEETIRVAEVTIMTESEFDAAMSRAPIIVPITLPPVLAAPGEEDLAAARPDAEMDVSISDLGGPDAPSDADAEADLSAVLTTNQVQVDDTVSTLAPELPSTFDTALNTPTSRPEPRPQPVTRPTGMTPPQPEAPSLRIDTTPAAPQAEDVRTDDTTQDEVKLSTDGTTELTPQEATAPEEAATEIIPEIAEELPEPTPAPLAPDPLDELVAEVPTPEVSAPLVSARPQARPDIPQPVAEPVRTVEAPTPQPTQPATQPAETAVENAPERTATAIPQGSPLTSGEIGNFTSAISSKWNVGRVAGLEGGDQLVVTVGITLDRNGRVVGDVRPIQPRSPDGAYGLAFSVARSAIIQASNAGAIILPPDKFGQWQEIEITFDPSKTTVGFGS